MPIAYWSTKCWINGGVGPRRGARGRWGSHPGRAAECIGRRMHQAAECIRRPNAFRGSMQSEAVCNQARMQSISISLLPIAYCLLPIAYCLLPIAYCILPIAYCLLPIANYSALLLFLITMCCPNPWGELTENIEPVVIPLAKRRVDPA